MDIEGTTTSISFVHDVLFPYARARMATFLSKHSENKEVAIEVDALRLRLGLSSLADVVSTLDRWMGEDRKETELKSLQGLLWRDGYTSGDFTGHVYPDVRDALSRWKDGGFSLRSIHLAQSLRKSFFFSTVTQAISMHFLMPILIRG